MAGNGPTRRQVMVAAAAAVAAPTAGALAARLDTVAGRPGNGSAIASGYVFDDSAASGVRATGSRGIAGVMVSNGRDVCLTDEAGRWRLAVADGDCVFVVKPSGWSQPQSGALPRFAHVHRPNGSPSQPPRRFAGVAPTGALPASIDFPLRRTIEPRRFDVVLIADTQPADQQELSYVRDAVLGGVAETGAAFAIHHGDVTGDDLSLFDRYLQLLSVTGMTWHHCPGNHDMNLDCPDGRGAFETWKRVFGPTHYAFQHGQATFILLNNVEYFGARAKAERGGRGYRGRIGEAQLAFVANVLRHTPEDHLIVVSMHVPLVNFEDPQNPADTTEDRRALMALLSGRRHTVSFSGHSHTTEHHYLGADDGFARAVPHHHHVLTAACGSWWSGPPDHRGIPVSLSRDGSPKGFHVLSIDANRYSTRFVAADVDQPLAQLRLLVGCADDTNGNWRLGARVRAADLARGALFVDVFDGGPRTEVTMEIDGVTSAPVALRRIEACNPYVVDFFARNAGSCKAWVEAARSSHLWSHPLPSGLAAGAYRIRASAVDAYGVRHASQLILEVAA
jgi:hypothetical protein